MWVKDTVENLCEIEYGTRVVRKREQGTIYPVYGGGGETFRIDRKNRTSRVVIARFGMSERCTRYVDGDFFLNDSGLTLSPKSDELSQDFLNKIIFSLNDSIYSIGRGTAQKNLNMDAFKKLIISYPPAGEQERIVAKLDAAFAEIDEVVDTTNESLKSIQQLFLTSLDTSVNADDLGELIPLGEICELAQGLAINKGTKHLLVGNSSKPLIRIKDLINETEEQYITDEYENTKTEVNEEDLIFTRTGSLGLVFRGRKGVLHNNSFKVTPNQAISKDYLYWWLKNPSFLDSIHKISGKAAQPDISHKLFKAQQIKVPTAAKQKDIVAKIELLFKQIEKMKKINLYKLHQIHALKSAMLFQELQPSEAA